MENKRIQEMFEVTEQMQEELAGIEHNRDDDEDLEKESIFSEKEIRVSQRMITVFMIENWIREEMLNLQPDYQRNLVWDLKRKSALIESMLLNIPIPAFYFDEDSKGEKNVIDGLQRLSTIHQYINDGFELNNLQYLPVCENKTFSQLDIKYRTRILETMLVVNILDERCSPMIKMDIFRRVNTGGIHLNPQEIRNIMATSRVRNLLRRMSTCEEFICATNEKVKDVRMGAQELCLRYITLLSAYNWDGHNFNYYHGLLKMMDACILALNKKDDMSLNTILERFKKIMKQCYIILGERSFCKYDNNRINKSLFTSWAIVLFYLELDDSVLEANKQQIATKYFAQLQGNTEFYNSITSSTGSRKYILYAIEIIRGIMEEYYDF